MPTSATAIDRTGPAVTDTASLERWLTQQLSANPNFKVPAGYEIHNGVVRKKPESALNKVAKVLPYVGAGIAGGAGILGALGGGAGAATSMGAGGIPSVAVTAGIPAGAQVGTAAGGGGMNIGQSILGFLKKPSNIGSILDTAGKVAKGAAPVLGEAAASQGNQRNLDNQQQILRDRLNLDSANSKHGADLDNANLGLKQKQFSLDAPGQRLDTGVRGSMVSRAHNVTVGNGAPVKLASGRSITPIQFGGMGPDDLLSDDARSLGSMVTKQMLEDQTTGDHFDPMPQTEFPGATPAKSESTGDKILGGAATGTSILGAVGPILASLLKKRKPQMSLGTPMPATPNPDEQVYG